MASYLRANRLNRSEYIGHEIHEGRNLPPVLYPRSDQPHRMTEGRLNHRPFLPISRYLRPKAPASSQPAQAVVKPPWPNGTALIIELAVPSEPIPPTLREGEPITTSTDVAVYDYDGTFVTDGTLTRRVSLEGIEDVEVPAGTFADCARIRLDLEVHLPWRLRMNWVSYLWLSTQAGEVRRLQHMEGWFLIFPFESAFEYGLLRRGPAVASVPSEPPPPPLWSRVAVLLDHAIPHPRIGGMIVDYADQATNENTGAEGASPASGPAGP